MSEQYTPKVGKRGVTPPPEINFYLETLPSTNAVYLYAHHRDDNSPVCLLKIDPHAEGVVVVGSADTDNLKRHFDFGRGGRIRVATDD
jgi:hypothetical protein